jgi:cell division protein FtsL
MTDDTFEYAIKKDVRNNPIVREVDRDRQRSMARSMGVGAFLVAVLLISAWQHFELLQHGYRLEQMRRDLATEVSAGRHLHLEIETLRSPARIERIAKRDLHMVEPRAEEASIIERVVRTAEPPQSVIARR